MKSSLQSLALLSFLAGCVIIVISAGSQAHLQEGCEHEWSAGFDKSHTAKHTTDSLDQDSEELHPQTVLFIISR